MNAGFVLDPRLQADTHAVEDLGLSRLLLMDDARFPWLILVPRVADTRELIDLETCDQQRLLAEVTQASHVLRRLYQPLKLNVAALGNVVAQLHVHVVARNAGDAAWPRPVWGTGERERYAGESAQARVAELRTALAAHAH